MVWLIVIGAQLVISGIICWCFIRQTKRTAPPVRKASGGPYKRDLEVLMKQRKVHLTAPMNDRMRPARMQDVVGQADGVKALVAMLSGPSPQHVIIYGPPGVGKTCAARLALEEAKLSKDTPFAKDAAFIEMDATCVRFDERAIADPLMGSVHDPIYQGAGQLGVSGVPQPKPGAVNKAHGGVLFLDEIGELHPVQMNKLLKVLEDHKVFFESAYYNPDDTSTPEYIHQIFQHGMPADFRLVGATTRSPHELPAALRSRCMEVFFRPLDMQQLSYIASKAVFRAGFQLSNEDAQWVGRYVQSGREAIQMVQMACGLAQMENRKQVTFEDLQWVAKCCGMSVQHEARVRESKIGQVFGLAVSGAAQGMVIDIEAATKLGKGKFEVTGIIEEEELGGEGHKMRRASTASGAVKCVTTALTQKGIDFEKLDIHLHLPGGVPVDGPSAGVAMAVCVYSSVLGLPVRGDIAMTGEITVDGAIRPVGGVAAKVEAARRAGLARVFVPKENELEGKRVQGIEVTAVSHVDEVLACVLDQATTESVVERQQPAVLSASGVPAVVSTAELPG